MFLYQLSWMNSVDVIKKYYDTRVVVLGIISTHALMSMVQNSKQNIIRGRILFD